jgi:hypothetical protein
MLKQTDQVFLPQSRFSHAWRALRHRNYYTMAFVGMTPFRSLLAGGLAHRFGAPNAVMLTGAFCLVGAAWYTTQLKSIRSVMRPIYIEMGIMQNAAAPSLEDRAGTN